MYWNANCRDIKGWPILSEIRAGTVPGDGEVQREGRMMDLLDRLFCNFSWECPPSEGCICSFEGAHKLERSA